MSFHNHGSGFTPEMLEGLDRAGLEDETIGRPYPRVPADPAEHFHRWLTEGAVPGHEDGSPTMSFFHFERTWWDERHRPNVLLVHYNDLKADLSGEMRRVADFLGIPVPPDLWPELVEAAGFEAMRRDGEALMGSVAANFQGGAAASSTRARTNAGAASSARRTSPSTTPRSKPSSRPRARAGWRTAAGRAPTLAR